MTMSKTLRLGTRGSMLATTQSRQIADAIERAHGGGRGGAKGGVQVELVTIRTGGDAVQDRPLAEVGGKGLFTREIERALLEGEIDFAVHSYKDVPVTEPLIDVSD